MPRLIFSAGAVEDLQRLRRFLIGKAPIAANRTTMVMRERLERLLETPEIGRPLPLGGDTRELVIPFGDGGYVARYRYNVERDEVYGLAIRHQKEVGF